jgi:uncharacterized protein involved in exopolysaccharide biosynthesis
MDDQQHDNQPEPQPQPQISARPEDAITPRLTGPSSSNGEVGHTRRRRSHPLSEYRPLSLFWQLVLIIIVVSATSLMAYPLLPRSYLAEAQILFRPTDQEGRTTSDQARDALDDNAIQTRIDVLRSRPLQLQVVKKLNLMNDPEFNPTLEPGLFRRIFQPWIVEPDIETLVEQNVLKKFIVRRERKSYVMEIGYEVGNPQKAAKMTNILVTAFFEDQMGRKIAVHNGLLDGLAKRVNELRDAYLMEERIKHAYEDRTGLLHQAINESDRRQLEVMSSEVAQAHAKTVEAISKAQLLAKLQADGNLADATDALASPLIQRLQERLVGLQTGAGSGSMLQPSGGNNAVIAQLRDAINVETKRLVRAAQATAEINSGIEKSEREELKRLDDTLVQWQAAQRGAEEVERSLKATQDALAQAVAQDALERSRTAVLQPDAEAVSMAVAPISAAFPDPKLYLGATLSIIILACVPSIIYSRRWYVS